MDDYRDELDFTYNAMESLYDTVDNTYFKEQECYLIYDALKSRLKVISFGDYLRRYIYQKAGLEGKYQEIPIKEYQQIICYSFLDNHTPPSFEETTAKLSALAKNWLTQQSVSRKVVFLLGFGLRMSVADVNAFLTKALREPEMNSKDPFEAICWYCYEHRYSYIKYERLWKIYQETPPDSLDMRLLYEEYTINVREKMYTSHDDAALIFHLSKLKTEDNKVRFRVAAREHFNRLYDEARDLVVDFYRQEGRACRREDITGSDIERILYSAIPVDGYGNLTPGKDSKLYHLFLGKRFNRQRIHGILANTAEINRFDLITLNFFIFSQKNDEYFNVKRRYTQFIDTTNKILEECCMGKLYTANPYECFLLMCILSEDSMGTYADVWELSYQAASNEREI